LPRGERGGVREGERGGGRGRREGKGFVRYRADLIWKLETLLAALRFLPRGDENSTVGEFGDSRGWFIGARTQQLGESDILARRFA